MQFDIVVATDSQLGIGKNNSLPWHLQADMAFFKSLTTSVQDPGKQNAVIMGRKTWESLPARQRPLKGRLNIVLSHNKNYPLPEGTLHAFSLNEALQLCQSLPIEKCFVIGGAEVFSKALIHPWLGYAYITELNQDFCCDTFFPDYKDHLDFLSSSEKRIDNGIEYCFKIFKAKSRRAPHTFIASIMLVACLLCTHPSIAKDNTKNGAKLFVLMNCSICHTNGGNNLNPDKPLKGMHFYQKYRDDQLLAAAIRQGFPARGMPPYGKDKLTSKDLSDIIAYLRSLTPQAK